MGIEEKKEFHGLGTIAEGGLEACNKLLRRYRIRLSRKCTQVDNLKDCGRGSGLIPTQFLKICGRTIDQFAKIARQKVIAFDIAPPAFL